MACGMKRMSQVIITPPTPQKKHFNLGAEGGAFLMFYSLSSSCWPHSLCDLCICESTTSSVW